MMSSDDGETVDITSSSEGENEKVNQEAGAEGEPQREATRRDILSPIIHSTVAALGGVETDAQTRVTRYVPGDDCLGCLRDLKKLWRKDDTDDERTVARVFWEARVLINDLVPILIETAGGGVVGDKRSVACADVIAAMTWPIDIAEELKELDEQHDEKTDYATLILAQLHYKEVLLRPEVLKALQNLMMPCIAKDKRSRTERDSQIVSLILHIFRNLLALKDPPRTSSSLSSTSTSLSSLQTHLITSLRKTEILDLLLTCASNVDTPEFSEFSAVLLEIMYLLVRGVGVKDVVRVRAKMGRAAARGMGDEGSGMVGDGEDEQLKALLEREKREKQMGKRGASTRHSRFGTTITLKANKEHYVLHGQKAITADPSQMIDMVKKKRAKKTVKADEAGVFNPLSSDALSALAGFAGRFVESCFNTFMSSVLKDIKSERPKFTEKDNLRLLFVTKWFLEFFLLVREEQELERKKQSLFSDGIDEEHVLIYGSVEVWPFGYVSEVVEHAWAPWVLRRMRAAVEEKPKQWVELHAGMDCLVQMLNLITLMAQDPDEGIQEAAETLQHQLYYNGEALDVALDGLRGYKDQSIAFLDSAVHLAYVILRMLEKWAHSQGEMYVRKRKKKAKAKRAKGGVTEETGIVDVESEEEPEGDNAAAEDIVHEQMFVFEKYEAKFAQEDIAHACLIYLARWREFTSSEQMRRIVSTMELFQSILKVQSSLPKDQPYKDLLQLINFVLRKFFKNVQDHPMLLVEAFYPKNRGQWKAYSSYEPEVKSKSSRPAGNADLSVKKGFKATEQIGIAVACMVEEEHKLLIDWVVDILKRVGRQRQAIIDDTDVVEDPPSEEDEEAAAARHAALARRVPSKEAMDKFEDYRIPYVEDAHAEAATSNKYLKLLMRLVGFTCVDDEALELEWHVPASLPPSELQTSQNVIEQYLANPIDLQGKKAKDHVANKRGPRRQRRAIEPSSDESSALSESGEDDFLPNEGPEAEKRAARKAERQERRAAKRRARDEERTSKKRERKKKETVVYKSAELIQDSDAELGDDEAFFARERKLMGRAKKAGEGSGTATMLSHGTKKRVRKEGGTKRRGKRSKDQEKVAEEEGEGAADTEKEDGEEAGLSDSLPERSKPKAKPKPRPKPKPKQKPAESDAEGSDARPTGDSDQEEPTGWSETKSRPRPRPRPRPRVPVESDAEEEGEPEKSALAQNVSSEDE
ncbi:timeless-domain-containing protein [Ceratobasidium sp. AG-I]|nr:timeless-domain-containing protein [Ceratobasidium sp. AG-I]